MLSNHGGRQLGWTAAIDQLSYIRAEVGLDFPIIVDSGFMSGLDIVKALSLGADFVFIGRGFLYAVAALGNRGGEHAAKILFEELRDVMAQMGLKTLKKSKD